MFLVWMVDYSKIKNRPKEATSGHMLVTIKQQKDLQI